MGKGKRGGGVVSDDQVVCMGYFQTGIAGFTIFLSFLVMIVAQGIHFQDYDKKHQCVQEVQRNDDLDFPQCFSEQWEHEDDAETMSKHYYTSSPDQYTTGIVDDMIFAAVFGIVAAVPMILSGTLGCVWYKCSFHVFFACSFAHVHASFPSYPTLSYFSPILLLSADEQAGERFEKTIASRRTVT